MKEMIKGEKAKKMLVFTALGLLFAASIYLIFKPSGRNVSDKETTSGINTTVPQATSDGLAADKMKVYELGSDGSEKERENAIATLSESYDVSDGVATPSGNEVKRESNIERSVRQYQETTDILTTFYENGYDSEKEELRDEVERLNREIQDMEESRFDEEKQLELLEKSYQMASKYLPVGTGTGMGQLPSSEGISVRTESGSDGKDADVKPMEVLPDRSPLVSSLGAIPSDEEFIREFSCERNLGFITPTADASEGMKNTIACKVDRTTTVRDNETLQLRLLESVRIGDAVIPKNSLLTARSKLSDNRMMLLVSTVEIGENIYPVKLSAYDMDGLEGVFIPGSEEIDALKEIGADIGSSMGTSFTFSSSAKDQIIADAAKGLMQGTSNYIVKKIRTIKVTFKGGHRLMLMPAR